MTLQTIDQLDELFRLDIVSRFEEIAASAGDRVAVRTPSRTLTYKQLNDDANRAANSLVRRSGSARFAALLFEHEVDMVVGVLAVLKAGLGYVPLDASYPTERLRLMVEAAGRPPLLTIAKLQHVAKELYQDEPPIILEEALAAQTAVVPAVRRDIHAPAYLLFTSGSTGKPKGVMQTHRNMLYHTWVWIRRLEIAHTDRLSLQSAYSWDSSVQDMFGALLSGAALYPVNLKTAGISEALSWMQQEQVSVYHSTLPIFRQAMKLMRERGTSWPALRMLAVGGDSVYSSDLELCRDLLPAECKLAYAYGATESSTALMNVVRGDVKMTRNSLPLGVPAPHARVYLDPAQAEANDEGEIIVGSAFICDGYLNEAKDTVKFFADPDDPAVTHYRTGDIGRRMPDGSIALVGRLDNVVKIRGMRVDLAEVEGAVNSTDGVEAAVVKAADFGDDRILVAYVVRRADGPQHNVSTLTSVLAARAPSHAVPSRYVFLPALPLTPNGKIDRNALPAYSNERPELAVNFTHSHSPLQAQIVDLWEETLGVRPIGIHDNFFDLGGNSLLIARIQTGLQQILDSAVPLFQLYAYPTVAALATFLEQGDQHDGLLAGAGRRAARRQSRRNGASYANS